MTPFLTFFLALGVSLVICLFLEKASGRLGLMDAPSERKMQKAPVPRAGGFAIFTTYFLLTLYAGPGFSPMIWMGAVVVYLGGLYDDLKPRNTAKLKLGFQVLGAGLAIGGICAEHNVGVILAFVSFGFILCMTNSFNLMDNMNGLTAGMTIVLILMLNFSGLVQATVPLLLCGAVAGFLLLNFPWGRIFMGDQGSQFLGYWTSVLAIKGLATRFDDAHTIRTIMVGVAFLAVAFFPFILDTALVVAIRWYNGRPISVGDQNHLSHQLLRNGVGVHWVPIVMVGFQTVCAFTCYLLAQNWLSSV